MTKREILDVFVRCFGFYLIGTSLVAVPDQLGDFLGAIFSLNFFRFVFGAIRLVWPLALGWWFLKGAPQLFQIIDGKTRTEVAPPPPSAG